MALIYYTPLMEHIVYVKELKCIFRVMIYIQFVNFANCITFN